MSPRFSSPAHEQAFNALVWEIVRQIPRGKLATYGQIAALIPPPEGMNQHNYDAMSPRWVGGAMAGCPQGVPWQRVINSQGKISMRSQEAYLEQRQLLESESVELDARDRIDLALYRWQGPTQEWAKAHGLALPPGDPRDTQIKMNI